MDRGEGRVGSLAGEGSTPPCWKRVESVLATSAASIIDTPSARWREVISTRVGRLCGHNLSPFSVFFTLMVMADQNLMTKAFRC